MTEPYVLISVIGAVLVGYAMLVNRLIWFFQPVRMDCARRGEILATDSRLTDAQRREVFSLLDQAYNGWVPAMTIFAMPLIAVLLLLRVNLPRTPLERSKHKDIRDEYNLISSKLIAAHLGTSPIAALAFGVWFPLCVVAFAVGGVGFRRSVDAFRSAFFPLHKGGNGLAHS